MRSRHSWTQAVIITSAACKQRWLSLTHCKISFTQFQQHFRGRYHGRHWTLMRSHGASAGQRGPPPPHQKPSSSSSPLVSTLSFLLRLRSDRLALLPSDFVPLAGVHYNLISFARLRSNKHGRARGAEPSCRCLQYPRRITASAAGDTTDVLILSRFLGGWLWTQ